MYACMYICMYACVNCLIVRFRIYLRHISESEYDSSSVGRYCIALVPISRLLVLLFLLSMSVRIIFFLLIR